MADKFLEMVDQIPAMKNKLDQARAMGIPEEELGRILRKELALRREAGFGPTGAFTDIARGRVPFAPGGEPLLGVTGRELQRTGALQQELIKGVIETPSTIPVPPSAIERPPAEGFTNLESFGSGVVKGATLGYVDNNAPNDWPNVLGQGVGFVLPGTLAFLGTAPLGTLLAARGVTAGATLLAREFATGAALGFSHKAEDANERGVNTAIDALLFPVVGGAARQVSKRLISPLFQAIKRRIGGPGAPTPPTDPQLALPGPPQSRLLLEGPATTRLPGGEPLLPTRTGSMVDDEINRVINQLPATPPRVSELAAQETATTAEMLGQTAPIPKPVIEAAARTKLPPGTVVTGRTVTGQVQLGQDPTAVLKESAEKQLKEGAELLTRPAAVSGAEKLKVAEETAEQIFEGVTPPTQRRAGRPPGRAATSTQLVPGIDDSTVRALAASRKVRAGMTPDEAFAAVTRQDILKSRIDAQVELNEFRRASGEITGKRGRPARGGPPPREIALPVEELAPETAEQLGRQLARQEVRLPSPPSEFQGRLAQAVEGQVPFTTQVAETLTMRGVNKLAEPRGYKVSLEEGGQFKLTGPGGSSNFFNSLREANGFLETQGVVPRSPVERASTVVPETGESISTFEKVARDLELNSRDLANLERQKIVVEKFRKGVRGQIEDVPQELPQGVENAVVELSGSKALGFIEGVTSAQELEQALALVKEKGLKSLIIRTGVPGEFEVAYFREGNDAIKEAVRLRRQWLEDGPRSLSDVQHRTLARLLGSTDEEINAYISLIRGREPTLADIPDIAGGAPYKRQVRLQIPIVQPALSDSIPYRQMAREATEANLARKKELFEFEKWLQANIIGPLKGSEAEYKQAFQVVEGTLRPDQVLPRVAQAAAAYQNLMREYAQRLGIEQWTNYATHVTDFDTLWSAFRDQLLASETFEAFIRTAPGMARTMRGAAQFNTVREAALSTTAWHDLPRSTQRQMKEIWDFGKQGAETWEDIPSFLRKKLPKEIFSPYMLERKGGDVPFKEDLLQAARTYVPVQVRKIQYDPLVKKWGPRIEAMQGNSIFTEKGLMRKYFDVEIASTEYMSDPWLADISERISNQIGLKLITPEGVGATISLIRGGAYRGLLGVDSAVANATQVLNLIGEVGPVGLTKGAFKFAQNFKATRKLYNEGLFGEFSDILTEQAFIGGGPFVQRLLKFDKWLSKWSLMPFQFAEFLTRGTAFWAGLEQAAKQGLSFKEGIANAAARQSSILPPLQLSEAYRSALLEMVPKTMFGVMSSQRAPVLRSILGRLSTVFVTYPTQQAAFILNGTRDGFHMALKGEPEKLLRFVAMSGIFIGVPFYLAPRAGYDIRNMFGPFAMWQNLTLPFWQMAGNMYNAVAGERPRTKERARRELGEFVQNISIPQRRYFNKGTEAWENTTRGFDIDRQGRFMRETSALGELMTMFGVKSEAKFQERALRNTIINESQQFSMDKTEALDAFLNGDSDLLREFQAKWRKALTQEDVQAHMQKKLSTPLQRATRGKPREAVRRAIELQGR